MIEEGVVNLDAGDSFAPHLPSTAQDDGEALFLNPNNIIEYEEAEEDEGDEAPIYCICRKGEGGFMICCEACNEWFHGTCVKIDREMGERLPQYICHTCNGGMYPSGSRIKAWNLKGQNWHIFQCFVFWKDLLIRFYPLLLIFFSMIYILTWKDLDFFFSFLYFKYSNHQRES
jgi:hypothetical protein